MNPITSQLFPREDAAEGESPLLRTGWSDWSDWMKAMLPQDAQQPQFSTQRPNGWTLESEQILATAPGLYYDAGSGCGIYEWQARKVGSETKIVVYIGSTFTAHPELSLRDKIKEYCTHGSHKADLINDALTKGYELWFRVKSAPDRQTAEDLENELLDRYDYAWNVRGNGELRRILS